MKKYLYLMLAMFMALSFNACSSSDDNGKDSPTEKPDTPDPSNPSSDLGKILVVYYSYTNHVQTIINDLETQISADVIRIEPAEKGLDYAANNYAIGSSQIRAIRDNPNSASSYPAIDPVNVKFENYNTVIVATPLWWSNMAAPMQSFLFSHKADLAGKNIGLIVSSSSSGISGVEEDAKRLIPKGKFLSPSLWIRSSQTSSCHSLSAKWLEDIGYKKQ